MKIAVFDVGGTFIKYSIITDGQINSFGKVATPYEDQETFLKTIEIILNQLEKVEGIAFSLPGVIDVEKKYIFAGGSLSYNNHTDVTQWEKRFQLPIEIENDARCAALAELEAGNMQGIKQGLVLTFGTGVGGGLIINGEIYKGHHLIAGEVSVIFAKSPKKYCSKGMFGAIGSTYNLIEKIALAKNSNSRNGQEIFQWIADGDEISKQIFDEYCYEVICQLHNIQCLLDPERICIGGGVSENPIFIAGLQKASMAFYEAFPIKFPHGEIMRCRHCNDSNMLGAYFHYKKYNDER